MTDARHPHLSLVDNQAPPAAMSGSAYPHAMQVVTAAQRWAIEAVTQAPSLDVRTPVGAATLALLDAVHDLDYHTAGQAALFESPRRWRGVD